MNAEKKRNIRIGLFALVAFGVLCVGLSFLKGRDVFSSGKKIIAYFPTVDGLAESSPVIYNGFKIGSVSDISIDQYTTDPSKLFEVTLQLEKGLDVPIDSRAEIISTDILGGKGIELVLGHSKELAGQGDTVGTSSRPGLMDELMPIKDQASQLMGSADRVMSDLDSLIDQRNRQKLDEAIAAMAVTMKNLEVITRNLEEMTKANGHLAGALSSADGLMGSLDDQKNRIDSIMRNFNRLSEGLAKADIDGAVGQMSSLMSNVNEMVSGDGNIAKLAKDDKLYDNLATATENLNRLLVDVRLNPSRYINVSAIKFGGKQVYFSDTNTANEVLAGKVYTICIATAKEPKDMPTKIGGKGVLEYHAGKKYKYLISPFETEQEAKIFLSGNSILSTYPEAEIELYENGEKK